MRGIISQDPVYQFISGRGLPRESKNVGADKGSIFVAKLGVIVDYPRRCI